jgi:hypothetical protein
MALRDFMDRTIELIRIFDIFGVRIGRQREMDHEIDNQGRIAG